MEHVEAACHPDHREASTYTEKIELIAFDGRRRSIDSRFDRFTTPWLFVDVDERIALSTVLSVEHDDVLFVGEVLACAHAESGAWRLSVKVEHKLTSLQSLMRLRSALLGEQAPISTDIQVGRS